MTARASVIVSTLDRAAYLARLLAALENVGGPPFEVVVVNGPSTDDTDAVVARWDGRVKLARCPTANLSRSRNLGIAAAAGEIAVFVDDDAVPVDGDWLAGICAPLLADPRVGIVGGPVLAADGRSVEFAGRVVSEYGDLFPPFEAAARGVVVDGTHRVLGIAGGNCAVRRDALLAIGGFDEAFAYYLDETDVCLRVARGGWAIVYAPRTAVVHASAPGSRRRSPYDRDWRVIARSDAYFAMKNATDPPLRRLAETVRRARGKWPYWQINAWYNERRYGTVTRLRHLARWAAGVVSGVCVGLARPRRTPLRAGMPPPPPFLPFK